MTLDFDRFRVLTFDCYGTLIDWESGILHAIRSVLVKHHVVADDRTILETFATLEAKHEMDEYVRYEVVLRMVMAEMSLRLGFDASTDDIVSLPRSLPGWKPFPDTVEALRKLKTRYQLAILSNVDDALFAATARSLKIPFDWVVTAQQASAYKPDRRIFEHAFTRLAIPREQILHVAQSVYHDIVPARALGVACVWVNRRKGRTGTGATAPAAETPDLEVASLQSLVEVIGL
jgi:2-haloacid dehalogenase